MAIRIRMVENHFVAICAARSVPKEGDVYLDDAMHHALAEKFAEDFENEGFNTHAFYPQEVRLRAQEESNNPARVWWDATYKMKDKSTPNISGE